MAAGEEDGLPACVREGSLDLGKRNAEEFQRQRVELCFGSLEVEGDKAKTIQMLHINASATPTQATMREITYEKLGKSIENILL